MASSGIPFVRPVRVGNFKLWRSRGGGPDCINVSDLDGMWRVRVPGQTEFYSLLAASYDDYVSDSEERRRMGERVIDTILSNVYYVSSVGNGYFHRAVMTLAVCYAHPSVLSEGDPEHGALMRDVESLVSDFLHWCAMRDTALPESTEEDDRRDGTADRAREILDKEE